MKTSEQVDKVLPKLAAALKDLGSVKKSAENPFFKSRYADLNTHLDVAEKALEAQGLILLQPVGRDERGSYVESVIVDPSSSQFVSSSMDLILSKQDMQNAGSAVTYARRYTLGALLSMQAVDDDAEASMGRGKNLPTSATTEAPKARSSFRKTKGEAIGANSNGQVVGIAPNGQVGTETTEGWS